MNLYDTASELYTGMLGIYLSDAKRKNMDTKYNPTNSIVDTYDYTNQFVKRDKESDDTILEGDNKEKNADIPNMPSIESNDN